MAGEWYYTTNKQQMGPVSWDELRQLAHAGLVKPNDLVWTDGMPEWVKATRQEGLFPEEEAAPARPSRRGGDEPAPPRRPRRRDRDEEEPQAAEERPAARRSSSGGGGIGLKIGLAIGAVVFVLLLLFCGGGAILLWVFWPGGGGANITYSTRLIPNTHHERTINVNANQRVQISVNTPNPGLIRPDVDLFVFRNNQRVASDTLVSPNANVNFVAPATGAYRVRVVNLGPGMADSRVTISIR